MARDNTTERQVKCPMQGINANHWIPAIFTPQNRLCLKSWGRQTILEYPGGLNLTPRVLKRQNKEEGQS